MRLIRFGKPKARVSVVTVGRNEASGRGAWAADLPGVVAAAPIYGKFVAVTHEAVESHIKRLR